MCSNHVCITVTSFYYKYRASLKSSDYYQPEPEPRSGLEEHYQVVAFQAKVIPFRAASWPLPGHFWEAMWVVLIYLHPFTQIPVLND